VRLRPLEALNGLALAGLSVLTLALWVRLPAPGELLLRFAVMGASLGLVGVLARRPERLPSSIRLLVDFYPAAFLPLVFESLGPLIAAARGPARDDLLIAADRALFGVDVTVWLERFVRPALTDLSYLFYVSYYFIALALGGALWRRAPAAARRFVFTISLCYYVSYAGYFTIPAFGPRVSQREMYDVSLETSPVSRSIARTIDRLEKTKLDVFPSGHTMIAVAVLLVAYRRERRLFWFLLPFAAGLIVSTVYCRYHYVVDLIAGGLLAWATVPLGERLYDRLLRERTG